MLSYKYFDITVFILILLYSLSACNDNDEAIRAGNALVGKWYWAQSSEYNSTLEFRSDGTFNEMEKEYYSSGEWVTTKRSGTYVYDDEDMILYLEYDGGEFYNYEITELTSSVMIIGNIWGEKRRTAVYTKK